MSNLKERFEQFMSKLEGVENIDALMSQSDIRGRLRADYLVFKRHVIIEQKSLDVDVDNQVQSFIDGVVRERGIVWNDPISLPSFIQILANLHDGSALKKKLREILTKRIDDILAKADKQTRDTRETFCIPEAIGIVVVLNENAPLIEPDYFQDKAFSMLRKQLPTGKLQYPNNQVVFLISEAHRISSANNVQVIPTETTFSESGNQILIATHYVEILRQRWAEFNLAFCVESSDLTRDVATRDPQKLFQTTPL